MVGASGSPFPSFLRAQVHPRPAPRAHRSLQDHQGTPCSVRDIFVCHLVGRGHGCTSTAPPRRAWELCLSPPPSPSPGCSGSGPAPQETGRHRAGVSPILFLDFARLCFVFCRKRARFVSVPRSAAVRGQKRRPACPPVRPALTGVLVPGRAPPPPRARLRPLSTVSTPRQDRPSPHGPALVPTTTLQPAGLR